MNLDSFVDVYRGDPPYHGNFDAPAGDMAAGIGVVTSGTTVAKAGRGIIPEGFLNSEVTEFGSTYEEDIHIPLDSLRLKEVKRSTGKISVIGYQPGVYYIIKGNFAAGIDGGAFAVDEYVLMAANGEFTNLAGAAAQPGDFVLGVVVKIGVHHMGEDACVVWQAVAGLGPKA